MFHIAVVHVGAEICFITGDVSTDGLAARVAEYIRERLFYQLEPRDADRVRLLLAEGRAGEAVDLYFQRVGRWDHERLVTRQVSVS